MRIFVLAALLTGCGFEGSPGVPDMPGDDGDGVIEETPDDGAPVAISEFCADPSVRLCLEFDESLDDGTGYQQSVLIEGAGVFNRGEGAALAVNWDSVVEVAANDTLDVRAGLTIELWATLGLQKIGGQGPGGDDEESTLIEADDQFALGIKPDGNVECKVGDKKVSAGPGTVSIGAWHHYACTWDGTFVVLYLDGQVVRGTEHADLRFDGEPGNILIAASEDEGEREDTFTGALDNLRVFSRALDEAEICSIGCL